MGVIGIIFHKNKQFWGIQKQIINAWWWSVSKRYVWFWIEVESNLHQSDQLGKTLTRFKSSWKKLFKKVNRWKKKVKIKIACQHHRSLNLERSIQSWRNRQNGWNIKLTKILQIITILRHHSVEKLNKRNVKFFYLNHVGSETLM